MISLILYGRNDSYGYNLHKRAAISLNCMAEMLTAPDDEIIFVDYNTPDDFPTFPEAIQDTLTERAKRLLRILRVRPSQHKQFQHRTHLVALEPIARNVALRRSNPANRWVLSTNTDMVFVPQRGASLSEVLAQLPDAYYPLPRFEVPETLWESADRLDPKGTIAAFGEWGRAFHLNEIVLGADSTVKYDAPGDFQLVLRSDLWDMHGFHEGMLLGWHVDSNLAKRISLIPRAAGDMLDDIFGYHCDHTRQVTPAHKSRAAENDLEVFFVDVTSAQLPEQAETWGLAGETVEEISVNATSRLYLEALRSTTPMPLAGITPRIQYASEYHNLIDYSVDHVLPFVADAFASYRRDTVLGWFGSKKSLLERFAQAWKAMGFSKEILVAAGAQWLGPDLPAGCAWTSEEVMFASSDVFVFDWGCRDGILEEAWTFTTDEAAMGVSRSLRLCVLAERHRLADALGPARRFIGINAVCNDAEQMFHELVGAARTPIATRIRQGYISDLSQRDELLPALNAGGAGRKAAGTIVTRPGVAGCVFYLGHLLLDSGNYRLILEFDATSAVDIAPGYTGLGISVTCNSCLICNRPITPDELGAGALAFEFIVPRRPGDAGDWPETEFQLRTLGGADITIRRARLEVAPESDQGANLTDFDFFPLSMVGRAGTYGPAPEPARNRSKNARTAAIQSRPGTAHYLVFGPHVWLLPGRYEASFEFWADAGTEEHGIEARVEVVTEFGQTILAEQFVDFAERGVTRAGVWQSVTPVLGFDIRTDAPLDKDGLLEARVWSEGGSFSLAGLDVHRVGDVSPVEQRIERLFGGQIDLNREAMARRVRFAYDHGLGPQDVLWLAQVGPAGRKVVRSIEALPGVAGVLAHGPYLWLLPGHYEVTFELLDQRVDSSETGSSIRVEVVTDIGNRILAAQDVEPKRGRPFERFLGRRSDTLLCVLHFDITSDAPDVESGLLEFRVWSPGTIAFKLMSVRVREVANPGANSQEPTDHTTEPLFGGRVDPIREAVARRVQLAYEKHVQPPDVVRLLHVGPAARKSRASIEALPGVAGVLAYGPYMWLLAGHYEVTFELFAERAASGSYVKLEVVTEKGNRVLAERLAEPHWGGRRFERFIGRRWGKLWYTLPFEMTTDVPAADGGLLEFRVWSPGTIPFKLTAVRVRRVDPS